MDLFSGKKNGTPKFRPCSEKPLPEKATYDLGRDWAVVKTAVPLYVEQGSLLYRTGQQFSKSSLGRLETDQLSRVGIGSSFRATATLDPV